MDFVHAKPVEAALFYRLWNMMPVHNCHILSHFVTNCHGGAEPGIGGAEPGIHVGNSPAQHLLVFSNVLSKGYIQQQEGCKYPTEYSDS